MDTKTIKTSKDVSTINTRLSLGVVTVVGGLRKGLRVLTGP